MKVHVKLLEPFNVLFSAEKIVICCLSSKFTLTTKSRQTHFSLDNNRSLNFHFFYFIFKAKMAKKLPKINAEKQAKSNQTKSNSTPSINFNYPKRFIHATSTTICPHRSDHEAIPRKWKSAQHNTKSCNTRPHHHHHHNTATTAATATTIVHHIHSRRLNDAVHHQQRRFTNQPQTTDTTTTNPIAIDAIE